MSKGESAARMFPQCDVSASEPLETDALLIPQFAI